MIEGDAPSSPAPAIDCAGAAHAGLKTMFVDVVQRDRIADGQKPALRPVFLKTHGVARGELVISPDLPDDLRVGLFCADSYPALVRFSSDTLPSRHGFETTVGLAIKLFGVPGEKLIDEPDGGTADLILQNHDVFFVDDGTAMCRFTHAGVIERDYDAYLDDHPETRAVLGAMAKPLASVLASHYWSIVPYAFGPERHVKYVVGPALDAPPPVERPGDPDYLARDFEARMADRDMRLTLSLQFRTRPGEMPLDRAMVRWDETASPPVPVAELVLPRQNVADPEFGESGERLAFNIWRTTRDHAPVGTLAEARRSAYREAARLRRTTNGVPDSEPKGP